MPRGNLIRWNQEISKDDIKGAPISRIKNADPERYEAIVTCLEQGVGHNTIEKAFGLRWETIQRIANSEPRLNKGVEAIVGKLKRNVTHCLDRMNEIMETDPDSVSFRDLAVSGAIGVDKIEKVLSSQTPQHQTNIQINVGEAKDLNALTSGLDGNGAKVVDAEEVKPKDEPN